MNKQTQAWYEELSCKVCGAPAKDLLCSRCFDMLQHAYAQVCLNCGNYNFIEWNVENVEKLCKMMKWDFDVIYDTDRIIIIPFKQCPKCCEDSFLCGTDGADV